jgi:hypothetical protein
MSHPIDDAALFATVLSVKSQRDFGVLLHATAAVITLRDATVFNAAHLQGSHGPASGGLVPVSVGTQIILNDAGKWNTNTSALHAARFTVVGKEDEQGGIGVVTGRTVNTHGHGDDIYNNNNTNNNKRQGGDQYPSRRMHRTSMM